MGGGGAADVTAGDVARALCLPRPLRADGGADDDRAGTAVARRGRTVEGGTMPNASTCAPVSGRKVGRYPGRGNPK